MPLFRLVRSLPGSAMRNMSVDERIFARYLEDGIPVFRVYRWQSPSFTYGVSQQPSSGLDLARCAADGIAIAKRMTGGGILFHHHELTYSFVCSKHDVGEPEGLLVSYRHICAFLIRFYASLGLSASFARDSAAFALRGAPHELCSASHEKYDIVINGKKIGGNAQKRGRRAVFQHGSIPLTVDWRFVRRYAPGLPSDIASGVTTLCDELPRVPGAEVLEQKLIDAFASAFGVDFTEEKESAYETGMA